MMRIKNSDAEWTRANSHAHCPVPGCDSDHFCWWRILKYPTAYVLCMKVSDGAFRTSYLRGIDRPAYHHIIDLSLHAHGSLQLVSSEPITSIPERHEAYNGLLTGELSSFHRAYLNSRDCTGEMIKHFRYTTLSSSYPLRDGVAAMLNQLGLDLRGVPGFWYDQDEKWHLAGPGGILMPVVNRNGMITGCQINTDEYIVAWVRFTMRKLEIPETELWRKKMKYVWLSSIPKRKTNDEGQEYFIRKTGTGAQATLHYPESKPHSFLDDINLEDQLLVEGIHKSNMVAYLSDELVMAQAGASASQPEVARAALGAGRLLIAYDRDWMENPSVRFALTSQLTQIELLKPLDNVFVLYWPPEAGKGLDDVLLAGNGARVVDIPASEWLAEYQLTELPE